MHRAGFVFAVRPDVKSFVAFRVELLPDTLDGFDAAYFENGLEAPADRMYPFGNPAGLVTQVSDCKVLLVGYQQHLLQQFTLSFVRRLRTFQLRAAPIVVILGCQTQPSIALGRQLAS